MKAAHQRFAHKWVAAENVEEQQMIDMGVLERIDYSDIPRHMRPIPAKMVYACKPTPDHTRIQRRF